MSETAELKIVARIRSDFPTKFAIPRQSGLVDELRATVVFEPEFRDPEALRGIGEFSHLWLVWQFSQCVGRPWSPTVRPPRLGGNKRMGVFATRSPFRPNPLGLSCVRLVEVEQTGKWGTVLHVAGADLMDGTPIYDVKPYLPYADCRPEARGGFAPAPDQTLEVEFPPHLLAVLPEELRAAALGVLAQDPRPPYQNDPERIYGFRFGPVEMGFTVSEGRLTVCRCERV